MHEEKRTNALTAAEGRSLQLGFLTSFIIFKMASVKTRETKGILLPEQVAA
jgi:hypothetical protein